MAIRQSIGAPPPFPIVEGIEFREISARPGYICGTDGSIWSCRTPRPGFRRYWKKRKLVVVLTGPKKNIPYHYIKLGRGRLYRAAPLILSIFKGSRPDGMECRHFDGNSLNDRPDNLLWGTRRENRADSARLGRMIGGETHPMAKLKDSQIDEMRSLAGTMTRKQLGKKFGVTDRYVGSVLRYQNRTALSNSRRGRSDSAPIKRRKRSQ